MISRFDLLYIVLDQVDEGHDRKLAQHLVGLYLEDAPAADTQDILVSTLVSASLMIKLIYHCSLCRNFQRISYVEMRNMGDDPRASEKRIAATTRQLEGLIHLSEAHARIRFSEFVELKDVKESRQLMR